MIQYTGFFRKKQSRMEDSLRKPLQFDASFSKMFPALTGETIYDHI